jgi:hypothetical protein
MRALTPPPLARRRRRCAPAGPSLDMSSINA